MQLLYKTKHNYPIYYIYNVILFFSFILAFFFLSLSGIGPCYASKATRNGIRVGELEDFELFSQKLRKLYAVLQKQYDFEYDVEEEIERYRGYASRNHNYH